MFIGKNWELKVSEYIILLWYKGEYYVITYTLFNYKEGCDMLGSIFTENTSKFDGQIDAINETLDNYKTYGRTDKLIYSIAKPVAKAVLYVGAFINLFDFRD